MTGVEGRRKIAGVGEAGDLGQDLAVMRASLAIEQWQQGEHAGICGTPEGKRGQRMGAPAQRTDDMTITGDRDERGVERGTANRVVDDVEAAIAGQALDVVIDGSAP